MINLASFDPGKLTGAAIFDQYGKIITGSTIVYEGFYPYVDRLEKMKAHHNIDFAFIERYENFRGVYRKNAFKVQKQVGLIQEIFPNHIMVHPRQWNNQGWKPAFKKIMCCDEFGREFGSEHVNDAALMGSKIFQKAQAGLGSETFQALQYLSQTKREWPRNRDLTIYTLWADYKAELEQKAQAA